MRQNKFHGKEERSSFIIFVRQKKEGKKEKKVMENPGIDPGTSRMQSGRSTIWANPPILSNGINKTKQKHNRIYVQRERSKLTLFFSTFFT